MKELTAILEDATARVDSSYFQQQIDGGDAVYRERVYCYELYHQMRLRWPQYTDFHLNGELDKAAHPILRDLEADRAKPDLLVHRPGHMEGNHAIIEVKAPGANPAAIQKDLRVLSLFKRRVGYQRAIYLIFGYEAADLVERVVEIGMQSHELEEIELWLHQTPGEPAPSVQKFTVRLNSRAK